MVLVRFSMGGGGKGAAAYESIETLLHIQPGTTYPISNFRWTRTLNLASHSNPSPVRNPEIILTSYPIGSNTTASTPRGRKKKKKPSALLLRVYAPHAQAYEFKTSGTSSYHTSRVLLVGRGGLSYQFVSLTYTYCMRFESATRPLISRKIAALDAHTRPELCESLYILGKIVDLVRRERKRDHRVIYYGPLC